MADIRLAKPVAGTTQTVPSAPDGRFIFDFPADAATLTRNGDDLVLSFEDGSSIRLQGFYTTYSKEEMPSFQVEGVEISGQDFFAALGEDLMPAAGPAAGSSVSRGGRYNEYGGSDLLDGIDHLGRLDIGFGDGVEWADDQVGGWTHQNLDPEISGIIAVDGNDMTLVESGVETDGSQEIQGNVFTPGVPVVVGQVMASDPDGGRLSYSFADGSNRIVTEYGVITIDADTGVITYTLNNDDPDADSLALGETVRQDFTVRVEDGQGGKAEASFSVTIKGTNDQPEVTLDADSELGLTESGVGRTDGGQVVTAPGTEAENQAYDGSHADSEGTQQLTGSVTGYDVDAGHKLWFGAVAGDKSQDGSWEGAQSPDADIFLGKDATDGDVESSEPVEGSFGHLVLNSDGTWTYTLKGEQVALPEGTTVTLDGDEPISIKYIDELPEDAEVTDTFTIYVKDEHGAWNLETVTITITGTNDKPALEVGEQQGLVYESGVGRDPVTDAPVDDPAGSLADENVEYDNTERGTNTTTGTISASDVDRGDTLHFAVSKKGEATEIPQNSLTDTDRPVTAQGNYGTLEVKETGNGEATYTYTLADDTTLLSFPITVNGTTYATQDALETVLGWDLGDSPTLDNLPEGATVTDTFTIFVQDDKGAWVSKDVTITITGTNDQPTVELDDDKSELHLFESGVGRDNTTNEVVDASGTEAENAEYNGSKQLTGSVTGHDVDAGHKLWFGAVAGDQRKEGHEGWEGADAPGESDFLKQNSTAGGTPGQKPVEGTFGTLTLSSDGTWIYTLKGEQVELPEGTTVTLDDDEPISIKYIDELPEDAEVTDTFTIYVKDEHGAWNLEIVTITITGTNDKPELTLMDRAGNVVDTPLVTEEHDPDAPNDSTDWPEVSGRFEIADVDADAGLDQTIHIEGGSHTEDGKDYITNGDSSDGHIGSEGGGETSATFTTDYGTLTVNPDGSWTYVVNSGSELVQQLDPEHPHFETFEITVVDEHGAYDTREIVIKVEGSSAFPVITDKDDLVFKEEGVYHDGSDGNTPTEAGDVVDGQGNVIPGHHQTESLSGRVDATDVDLGDQGNLSFRVDAADAQLKTDGTPAVTQPEAPKLVSTSPNGDTVYESGYGTLTFHADGTYTYELKSGAFDADGNAVNKLAQGEVLTETFTVTVKDTFGKEVSTDITITIHGTNDKPRLELGDGSDGGALHVTESGVGRHDDGAVVDGPDDELVDAPSKDGTAADEIGRYDGALTDSDKATGKDADHGAELVYGVEAGKAESPDGVDFTTDGGDVSVRGQYGSLTIGADGSYSYTLDESSDFTAGDGTQYDRLDYLNEGETLTETFTIFVRDEHGAWASKEVTVTVTGTNDLPTLDVLDGKKFFDASGKEIAVADDRLHAYGTADSAADAVVRLTGRVQASDDDRENGAGQETTDGDNHGLQFSLQGTGYDPALTSSSVWKDGSGHDLGSGPVEVSRSGDGGYVATTEYGTLTLDQYGNYTYELHDGDDDVTALGKGETVTETFVVRVVDDRGAWSEKTITITIEGTDDKPVLSDDTESALDVYEMGVWGDQSGAHRPDDNFTGGPTGSQTVTVSFEKQDANDRHSLVIAGSGLPANASLTVTQEGTPVEGAIYSIVAGANGIYTLTAIIPGVNEGKSIMLGTLRLEQNGTDSDLTYTFVPTQSGLNGLPQDMDLSIDIPLKVKDQNGNLSEGEHTATINIHGTNDRPTIKVTGRAPEDVYAGGVGREENGIAVRTPDKMELNPAENEGYTSTLVSGKLTASDVDADNDGFTFYVAGAQATGKRDIPLKCTANGDDTVILTLGEVEVAKLVLDQTTGKYTLELLEGAKDALKSYGEDTEFSFKVTFKAKDEHGSSSTNKVEQTFTIHGTNDAPTITHVEDRDLAEDEASVTGNVTASDADNGDKLTYGLLSDSDFGRLNGDNPESVNMTTSLNNEFGTLKIDPATGKYTFYLDPESEAVISLPEGEKKDLTFHVAVRDDKGAWSVEEITITITGKDTATVFVGDAAVVSVVEAGIVPDKHPQSDNDFTGGVPSAHGKLEAKDYDTVDGRPNEVEFSINKAESGPEPTSSAFSKLDLGIQKAISQQFPDEDWSADADIQIMQGQYGTLYLNTATGQYFYQLDNSSDATNALKQGEIRYDDFSIHAQGTGTGDKQGADQPLKVAVKGSNDAPVLETVTLDEGQAGLDVSDDGFTVTGIVEDGGIKTVTGQIGATDVNSPDGSAADEGSVLKYLIKITGEDGVRYVGAQSGEYGYLKLNEKTGEYTFVFNNKAAQHLGAGDIGEASFTVVVLDEYNAISEEKELTFEITGKDDVPRISGSTVSITEDATDSVNIQPVKITDPDTGDEQHITSIASPGGESVDLTTGDGPWKTEGEYGTLTVTRNGDGSLSYTYQLTEDGRNKLQYLNEDGAHTSVKENFTVMGSSGGQSVTGDITVTINGVNDAPTLELKGPDGQSVSEEDPVEVKDWTPVKGTAVGHDVDDVEGDLRYSVDDADSATAAQDGLQTIKGKFGYLTIDAETGEYTYVVDPFSEAYRELQTGTQGEEHFTITVTDPYGATDTKKIVFDVTKVEGGIGPGSIELQEPETPTEVMEDDGKYEAVLPPSVESDFTELKDINGNPVKVDADDIWLVDNKGQSGIVDGDMTHVVQTEYGSLILERGDDDQWGYRFVLNNSSDIVQSLDEDDSIEKTFYVSAGTNQVPIHVTITGINDQPVIESVKDLTIEDTGEIVSGKVTTTDPDDEDVGSKETGEGDEQNLSYKVSAAEGSGITLTPKDGQDMGDPGTYTLIKDGTNWGEFTLNEDGSYSFAPSAEAEDLLAGEKANFDLTITVDDGSDAPNSSTEENLHITITGTNEAPVINGDELTLEATEDTAITVSGKLDVSDDRVNEGNLSFSVAAGGGTASSKASNMAAGQYGTLFINADGTYSYQLNNQMQAVQELQELGEDSEPLEETFTIFVKDQDGAEVAKTITVTINGTNDAPVLSLDTPVLTIKEGTDVPVTGNASATDVDKDDTLSYGLKDGTLSEETGEYAYETDYGTFYINKETGAYRFELNNTLDAVKNLRPTDVVDAKVTVVVGDGHGGVTEKELTVHIKGSDSVPEITDERSLAIDVAEEPKSTAEKTIAAEGWDRGPDGTHGDPLHYAAQGAQPVTIDGQVWQMVTGKYGTLYLDPKTGKYRYELTEDMNHLADGETATESFGKITIADSTGNKITETITVTIKGSNDAPEIAVSQHSGALAGTVTITDVDASDTHSVTFEGLRADAAGTPLSVDLATLEQEGGTTTVDVYDAGGTLIGKLELVYTKGTGTDDSLAYTFTPDEGYLNSLPVNGSEVIDFSITVSDTHDGTDTTDGLQFDVSNVNDAPVIDETLSQGPAEGSNTGTLAFTDADVRDAHSVTFGGLSADAAGTPLMVPDVEGLAGDTEVPVYRDGLQIGTLTLSYADGKLSYTLSTEGFENNLPVGESSIGFDLTVTDAQGSSDQLGGLQFGVSNVNDAPVIDETLSQGPAEGSNTGTLAFTDADVRDAHSVTFGGLNADAVGTPLTVPNVEGLIGGTEVPVYRDGLQIGTLTLSYADGKLSYTLSTEGFENNLPVGESSIGFDLTVTDAQGSSDQLGGLQFGVSNVNDAPVIDETLSQGPAEDSNTGTLAFTDADVRDAHSVTFGGLNADAVGTPLTVPDVEGLAGDTEVPVYRDGLQIGTLTLSYADGKLSYTLSTEGFENNLPVGESSIGFDLTVTDAQGSSDQLGGLQFGVSNVNDAPVIDETLSQGPAEGSNTGTLAFTDADVRDAHSVTFGGLSADAVGTPLTVPNVEGLTGDTEVPVYRDGLQIGTLTLSYADGKLSYTLSTEGFENNLPVGESSIGFDLTVTDAQGSSDTAEDLQFRVTGNGTTGGGIPAGEDDAALRAQSERQRLAAEEAGLLTAAASFVAGITPEPADPETFLQDTVPAQENGPEALVAEEIPLPQDETVLQEEMTDLPDADVPVSETPLADDLLAEPLLFAGLENADEMPEPVEMLRFETAEDMLPAEDADPATAATPPAFSGEESGDGGLLLPEGVEGLFGTDGDDYLRGGEGSDAIFGGAGNDIIVYDQQDYLVSGGSGIDFMVSDDTSLTLDGLLSNTSSDKPLVSGIEVLLKGEDALSLTSINDLADRYGITLGVNEAGEETLQLDDRWTKQDDGSYDFNGGAEADGGLTLETSLTPVETGDPASEAVQQQVFTLEHSNG
ncbi:VCBS domain-containing protein [Desulfovibrio piger]